MILVFNNGSFTNLEIEDWIGNFPLSVCTAQTFVIHFLRWSYCVFCRAGLNVFCTAFGTQSFVHMFEAGQWPDQISSMTVIISVSASGHSCVWTCWDSRPYNQAQNRTDQICFVQYTALSLNTSLDFVQQFNFSRSGLVAQGPAAKPDTIYTI